MRPPYNGQLAAARVITTILLLALICFPACGYHLAGKADGLPSSIRTIGVPTFANLTQQYEVEQRFTRELIRELAERTRFRTSSDENGVDAILKGAITSVSVVPVIFGTDTFGSTYLVTITLRVSLLDGKTKKAIFEENNFVFRDEYVINANVAQFFSEDNPAFDRIARDFAATLVSLITERF